MKYLYSFLILIGGVAGFIGIVFLGCLIFEKIKLWYWDFEKKHQTYYKVKNYIGNKIMPWVVGTIMIVLFLVGLVAGYFMILEAL
jgi:hypothetical protein